MLCLQVGNHSPELSHLLLFELEAGQWQSFGLSFQAEGQLPHGERGQGKHQGKCPHACLRPAGYLGPTSLNGLLGQGACQLALEELAFPESTVSQSRGIESQAPAPHRSMRASEVLAPEADL